MKMFNVYFSAIEYGEGLPTTHEEMVTVQAKDFTEAEVKARVARPELEHWNIDRVGMVEDKPESDLKAAVRAARGGDPPAKRVGYA